MQVMDAAYVNEGGGGVEAGLRARLLAVMVLATTCAALLYVRLFNPSTQGFYPACPFHSLTGLNCPGCGITRGLHQLTHGHVLTALRYNALMLLLVPFLGYVLLSQALVALRGRGLPMFFTKPVYVHALFWLLMVFWILRNIPVYPLTLLSP